MTGPKFNEGPMPRKVVKKKRRNEKWKEASWMAAGFDVSTSSIAGAAMAWDKTLGRWQGPSFVICRWQKTTDYFDRLKDAALGHEFIASLASGLKVIIPYEDIYIAIEEPWAFGHVGKMQSSALKQQAEVSGAFMGGLLRYGYKNLWQINNVWWRQIVAADLGITIHHTKWNPTKREGKFRAKEWALRAGAYADIPEWPDLIEDHKLGLIPRPEGRTARAVQCDDRYEALAVMEYMKREVEKNYIG